MTKHMLMALVAVIGMGGLVVLVGSTVAFRIRDTLRRNGIY